MKKGILMLTAIVLLIGSNVFAAGDLIVDGKVGVGTTTPGAKLDVLSSNTSGLNVVTTKTGSGWLTGATFNFTDSSSAQNLSGLEVNYTHNGSVATNHSAATTGMSLNGSGTSAWDIGHIAQGYYMTFGGNGGTGYNYTNPNAYAFALRAYVGVAGDSNTHYIENIGGLQILHGYDNNNRKLSAKNLYGIIVGNISQYGSNALNSVTNAGGIQINKQTDLAGGRIGNLQGLWMNGDGAGADIVFGPNMEARIYSNAGELYAKDGAGNITQISPHGEKGEWIFYSQNIKTGRVVRVNMEELIKDMEKLTGKKYLMESFVNDKQKAD